MPQHYYANQQTQAKKKKPLQPTRSSRLHQAIGPYAGRAMDTVRGLPATAMGAARAIPDTVASLPATTPPLGHAYRPPQPSAAGATTQQPFTLGRAGYGWSLPDPQSANLVEQERRRTGVSRAPGQVSLGAPTQLDLMRMLGRDGANPAAVSHEPTGGENMLPGPRPQMTPLHSLATRQPVAGRQGLGGVRQGLADMTQVSDARSRFRDIMSGVRAKDDAGLLDLDENLPLDIRRQESVIRAMRAGNRREQQDPNSPEGQARWAAHVEQARQSQLPTEEVRRTVSLGAMNDRLAAEKEASDRGRAQDVQDQFGYTGHGMRVGQGGNEAVSAGLQGGLARRNARLERQGRDTGGLHAYPNMLAGQPSSQTNPTGGYYRGGNLRAPQAEAPIGGEVPPPAPNPELPYQQHLQQAGIKGDARLNRMLMGGYQSRRLSPVDSARMAVMQQNPNTPLASLMMGGPQYGVGMEDAQANQTRAAGQNALDMAQAQVFQNMQAQQGQAMRLAEAGWTPEQINEYFQQQGGDLQAAGDEYDEEANRRRLREAGVPEETIEGVVRLENRKVEDRKRRGLWQRHKWHLRPAVPGGRF